MLQRLRRTAQETISHRHCLERCRRLKSGLASTPGSLRSFRVVDVPAVVGWFRPVVLIPLSAMSGLSVEQFDAIIAHELAHIHRYDALVNLFQIAVETVLFYHPAVWWVNRLFGRSVKTAVTICCGGLWQRGRVCARFDDAERQRGAKSGDGREWWSFESTGGSITGHAKLRGYSARRLGRVGVTVCFVRCVRGGSFQAGPSSAATPAESLRLPPHRWIFFRTLARRVQT